MLKRWNLVGRLNKVPLLKLLSFKRQLEIFCRRKHIPNFHIVMPGDPPTLFPLSRCGLAGTIGYGSLDVIVNVKRFAPFTQS